MENEIRVLRVPCWERPYEEFIDNTLESFQSEIGGHIEVINDYPSLIIVDEEGKLKHRAINRSFLNENLVGTIVCCGSDGENFSSITDTEIARLTSMFDESEIKQREKALLDWYYSSDRERKKSTMVYSRLKCPYMRDEDLVNLIEKRTKKEITEFLKWTYYYPGEENNLYCQTYVNDEAMAIAESAANIAKHVYEILEKHKEYKGHREMARTLQSKYTFYNDLMLFGTKSLEWNKSHLFAQMGIKNPGVAKNMKEIYNERVLEPARQLEKNNVEIGTYCDQNDKVKHIIVNEEAERFYIYEGDFKFPVYAIDNRDYALGELMDYLSNEAKCFTNAQSDYLKAAIEEVEDRDQKDSLIYKELIKLSDKKDGTKKMKMKL